MPFYNYTKEVETTRLNSEISNRLGFAPEFISFTAPDTLSIFFEIALSGGDETILDDIVIAHVTGPKDPEVITEEKVIAYITSQTMKATIQEYTFDASAKTISFDSFQSIELSRILLITNVTDSKIIYNPFDSTKSGSIAGNVLTLIYDTIMMDDTDILQIIYDSPSPIVLIDVVGDLTYIGKARGDGSPTDDPIWQIQRIDEADGTIIKWADGNDKYDNVWDDRISLTYS